ncbi:MAG: flagellar assembly peptidoglycan hydrolase FlgJ [Congregibacter sp.]
MYTDFGALADLRLDARQDGAGSIKEVASQFESIFVQMMVSSMRDATLKGGLFESNQLEAYEQMYDRQLSQELAKAGGVGLADVIVRQFEQLTATSSGPLSPEQMNALPNYRLPSLSIESPEDFVAFMDQDWDADSPEAFVESLRPLAERAAQRLGVDADTLLAQAALETGWGKHVIARDGVSSNNLFNIKADSRWAGESITRQTLEYRDGVAVRESASFRAYPSAQASFDDYVDFVGNSPRYAQALSAESPDAFLRELQQSGYATDPAYADKVAAVRAAIDPSGSTLALKNSQNQPITH